MSEEKGPQSKREENSARDMLTLACVPVAGVALLRPVLAEAGPDKRTTRVEAEFGVDRYWTVVLQFDVTNYNGFCVDTGVSGTDSDGSARRRWVEDRIEFVGRGRGKARVEIVKGQRHLGSIKV